VLRKQREHCAFCESTARSLALSRFETSERIGPKSSPPPLALRLRQLLGPGHPEALEELRGLGALGQGKEVLRLQGAGVGELHQRPYPAEKEPGQRRGLVVSPRQRSLPFVFFEVRFEGEIEKERGRGEVRLVYSEPAAERSRDP